ncbi:barstar family protein [Taylorella equigenitalis]|uniref:Barstar (barnase inhibitor) domain-containing protein n=3 Tax=Taylorella equigenitalis TaxID=29575 RepID=A0A654KFV5_TAYEM|nr:barstar family protein [Taylorella equigenitalis]ADU91301.1 hypothetical protein TEQUI_0354 [Taylorella equigenitalis MCE9]AFN36397.1 hypothetical protein KUI_1345 [Taylorella equigenitalis ATCC 35865]ASY30966.1 hypothetical protein B9Z30_06345 [Taylorella equigenitalis]ASY38270.1 hypothetical protein CA605_06265 [Taylorella equigenitalis]ASY39799.1 hypothetical protein CA604_06765 [Taylorella equigenitalis]
MNKKVDFSKVLSKSAELPSSYLDSKDEIIDAAVDSGLAFFECDCSRARNLSAILRAVSKSVDYPVFFGKDLDAFADCLSETLEEQKEGYVLWFTQLHTGDPELSADTKQILKILKDTCNIAKKYEKTFIYFIDHAGELSAPEPGVEPERYAGNITDDSE